MVRKSVEPSLPYHHGDLRAALLRKAVALIRKRGDVAFSLRELASLTGVSHTAVYRHFPNRGALLAEVASHGFDLLAQALTRAAEAAGGDRASALGRLGQAYVAMAMKHPAHFTVMFSPDLHGLPEFPRVREAADRAFNIMAETVALLWPDADPQRMQTEALRCWALVHGLATLQISGNLGAYLPSVAAPDLATLLNRLLPLQRPT